MLGHFKVLNSKISNIPHRNKKHDYQSRNKNMTIRVIDLDYNRYIVQGGYL